MAVLLAIFFMILLSMIGLALIGMVPVELRSSTRTKLDLQAHYAVTSGIRHARAWCSAVMTPASSPGVADFLGDDSTTTGNSFYSAGGSYLNEITGINGDLASVEYKPMRLGEVFGSGPIPTVNARWTNSYKMFNIPDQGDTKVDDRTVVLVQKAPLKLGEWEVYSTIIPDADTPGGIRTQNSGGTITAQFGGTGKAGRRCYQIVSIAFYQGFPTLRAKSTVLEDSFARYSLFVHEDSSSGWYLQGLPGQITTLGPVHTNGTFKFALNPALWSYESPDQRNPIVPFNGLLTFARDATTEDDGVVSSLNFDKVVYSEGNDADGQNINARPHNDAGAEIDSRYSKMLAGGKSSLRKSSPVTLPPDSTKLANAAYGTGFTTGLYSSTAASEHVTAGGAPDGIFVFPDTTGNAAGGAVLKGDQTTVFLEVVDQSGKPMGVDRVDSPSSVVTATDLSSLENGSATGNPAVRAQAKTAQTSWSTWTSMSTSVQPNTTSTFSSTLTTGSSVGVSTGTVRSTLTTGSSISTNVSTSYLTTRSTSYSTETNRSTSTSVTVSTIRNPVVGTTVGNSWVTYTTVTTLGGAGGGRQTITTSSQTQTTRTTTSTSTSYSTRTLGSSVVTNYTTHTSYSARTTGSSLRTSLSTRYLTTVSSSYGTTTTTSYRTTVSLSYTTVSGTTREIPVTRSSSDVYRPIDQMIETKNIPINLNPTMFQANGTNYYKRPAGAHGSGADMDVAKLGGITQLLDAQGNPLAATTIGKDKVVIIKQSRSNPKEAIVFVVPAPPKSDGSLLNGAIFSEGHIGNPGDPGNNQRGTGGLAGVNMGRKTVGGQIKVPDPNNQFNDDPDGSLFGRHPEADSSSVGIVNNLWQFGTAIRETDIDKLRADHGLGIVAQDVRVNARPDDFTSFWGAQAPNYSIDKMLNIHAVIMGGSSSEAGGLTINGFTMLNQLTPGNLGAQSANTPLIRFVGGLIVRNYYDRINGSSKAGWNSKNIYNQQLALKPPPYFPNNGLLIPLSYVEERIWADQKL